MIDRRAAISLGFRRLLGAAAAARGGTDAGAVPAWWRPPFAVDEARFLLACDRCDACIAACVPGALVRLPRSAGAAASGTPALMLDKAPCVMCHGWPCAAACDRGALAVPESEEEEGDGAPPLPRMARITIDTTTCLPYSGPECGACASECPLPGGLVWDGTRPTIGADCTGCGLCRQSCVTDPKALIVHRMT